MAFDTRTVGTSNADTLTGTSGNDRMQGAAGNDTLNGLAGDDLLIGNAGSDLLAGGLGDDSYRIDAFDTVQEAFNGGIDTIFSDVTYKLGDNLENVTLLGTRDVRANGNALDNVLTGNSGDNILNGGDGFDMVDYASATAGITVDLALNTPQAVAGHGSDTLQNIEGVIGSAFNDVLRGTEGANEFDGGAGVDSMTGGGGDDTYHVDSDQDVIFEGALGGTDTVLTTAGFYQLGNNVENAQVMSDGDAAVRGNALDNLIVAGSGDNRLTAAGGNDTVSYLESSAAVTVALGLDAAQATGGSGSDRIIGFENIIGSAFSDTLIGDTGDNLLSGRGGDDTVRGGAGADTLNGGAGADLLQGGVGADVYVFDSEGDSGIIVATADRILGFTSGTDKVDLFTIDANASTADDDAFTFIGSEQFSTSNATAQLRFTYNASSDTGFLLGSTDADADAEFMIALPGVSGIESPDLIL